jgi:hypothetical protein
MKATMTSTTEVVEMKDRKGRPFDARVWEGVTEGGIEFTAYICVVQVLRDNDNAEFERDLLEHSQPRAETQQAIDLRFVI